MFEEKQGQTSRLKSAEDIFLQNEGKDYSTKEVTMINICFFFSPQETKYILCYSLTDPNCIGLSNVIGP